MVNSNQFQTEFGRTVPMMKYVDYFSRYRTRFQSQARNVWQAISAAYGYDPDPGDVDQVFAGMKRAGRPELRDAWDTELKLDRVAWDREKTHYLLRSAGPDKQFDTGDDLLTYLEVRRSKIVGHPASGPSKIDAHIEHDRGSYSGCAEIVGTAVGPVGGGPRRGAIRPHFTP